MQLLRELAQRHLPHGRTLPEPEWRRRHNKILILLWVLAAVLPLYGIARGHAETHSFAGALSLVAIAGFASRARAPRVRASAMTAFGLCLASALTVHLSNGAIEAHFMFFVVIIVISLYEDWRPFLVAFGFVIIHHLTMGIVAHASVYNHAGNPWLLAGNHGGFVAAASIGCVVHWRLNEKVRDDSRRAGERARESEARFRSAFEEGPVGMALVEATPTGPGRLLQVNRTLCQQFGYRESALPGSELNRLLDAASITQMAQHVEALIAADDRSGRRDHPAEHVPGGRRASRDDPHDRPRGHPPGRRPARGPHDRNPPGRSPARPADPPARQHLGSLAVVFEITETAAITDVEDAGRFLMSLSKLGCGIALDDFGTGFGSLHYLKNLPVDFLKIDGQFIQNLTTNPDDLVVVESLVRMSRGLRMQTTAECVEDAATWKLLADLGVDFAQGFHIGRPGPARQVIGSKWKVAPVLPPAPNAVWPTISKE